MSLMDKYTRIYKLLPTPPTAISLSHSFKNSGRNEKHPFAARYNHPMHDLDYIKPILQHTQRKPNSMDKSKSIQRRKQKNPENTSQFRVSKSQKLFPREEGIRSTNYIIKSSNPEVLRLSVREQDILRSTKWNKSQMQNSSPLFKTSANKFKDSNFGLSQFQLGDTITGRINRRSSHHVAFEKMPNRPQNINTIWYKKDEEYSPVDRQKNKNIKHKIHYFKSDSNHIVFEPAKTLDKFYDVPVEVIKKRSDAVIRDFEKVKSRPNLQLKLGTNLEYEKSRSFENKKRPLYEISRLERKLVISKQVISPVRGTYR